MVRCDRVARADIGGLTDNLDHRLADFLRRWGMHERVQLSKFLRGREILTFHRAGKRVSGKQKGRRGSNGTGRVLLGVPNLHERSS